MLGCASRSPSALSGSPQWRAGMERLLAFSLAPWPPVRYSSPSAWIQLQEHPKFIAELEPVPHAPPSPFLMPAWSHIPTAPIFQGATACPSPVTPERLYVPSGWGCFLLQAARLLGEGWWHMPGLVTGIPWTEVSIYFGGGAVCSCETKARIIRFTLEQLHQLPAPAQGACGPHVTYLQNITRVKAQFILS